jgi:hypothetical protein
MVASRADFISRFLYRVGDDEYYWVPGAPPTPEVIGKATAAAKDVLGFDAHQAAFTKLAETIDLCTAEELASKGHGLAARNASKHPAVISLGKLEPDRRAGLGAAAAQGLAWMEDCRPWVPDATLRNQIAKRVMAAIVVSVGRVKTGYTPAQLDALLRMGTSLKDNDVFVLRARGAIAEILAGNLGHLPKDKGTSTVMENFLDVICGSPNAAPVFKAVEKLLPLTSAQHASRLRQAALKWRA